MIRWVLLVPLSGCAWVLNVNGGAAMSRDVGPDPAPPVPEAILDVHTDLALQGLGLGIAGRTRTGPRGFEFGMGPELCFMPALGEVSPYVCGGASLLTLGYRDDAFSLGAMSPYLQPSLAFALGDRTLNTVFVSVPVGYDVRFTGQPSSWFVGLTVGLGWSFNSERAPVRRF